MIDGIKKKIISILMKNDLISSLSDYRIRWYLETALTNDQLMEKLQTSNPIHLPHHY